MKICNNCSTINEDKTIKCVHCNMCDNFTYQGETQHANTVHKAVTTCKNCGTHDPGEGAKCVHCHFPLPTPVGSSKPTRGQENMEGISKLSVKANLRAS